MNETNKVLEDKPKLSERISLGLDRELKRQKEAGKEFISDDEIDNLIDKIIKEELGDAWKEQYTKNPDCTNHKIKLPLPNTIPSLVLDKILRLNQPYNLAEVLKGLIDATDILLHKRDYDGAGWERLEYCYRFGKEIVEEFENNKF